MKRKDLTVSNFALFKNRTEFRFDPLTLLIGANGNGKTSLIKVIEIINSVYRITDINDSRIDNLTGWKNYSFDSEKDIIITFSVAPNLFRKITVPVQKNTSSGTHVDLKKLEYFDSEDNLVLFLDYKKIRVDINKLLELFCNVHEGVDSYFDSIIFDEGLIDDDLNLRSNIEVKGLEEVVPPPGLGLIDHDFGNYYDFDPVDYLRKNNTIIDLIVKNAKTGFTIDQSVLNQINNALRRFLGLDRRMLPSVILKQNDLSIGNRFFTLDSKLGKSLKYYHSKKEYSQKFLDWKNLLFGKNSTIEIDKMHEDIEQYSVKLNGHYLSEHGNGTVKVLQIFFQLISIVDRGSQLSDDGFKSTDDEIILMNLHDFWRSHKMSPFLSKKIVYVEEPESNLHPDLQIKLAAFLYDFSLKSECTLLVETHSEYLVRAFQGIVGAKKSKSAHGDSLNKVIGIINFNNQDGVGITKRIQIENDGSLTDSFFSGFMNHSQELQLKLLMKNRNISSN